MRYVFFGTPRFAATVLEKLIDGGIPPTVLVCNPDRPLGRKKIITSPPTKQLIVNRKLQVEVFQPESKSELSAIGDVLFANADFGVVAAYAQIIPQEVIDKAKLGIIGVHPSLLPKLRGASPIQTAILEGHEKTGVNLFILDAKVDNGPVIASRELTIGESNYLDLEARLAELAGELLLETLPKFVIEKTETISQDDSLATYTKKFVTEDGFVPNEDLEKAKNGVGAIEILRKIRALNPEPGVYTFMDDRRTKLLNAEIIDGKLKLKKIHKDGSAPINL